MNSFSSFLILMVACICTTRAFVSYRGYKAYEVTPTTDRQYRELAIWRNLDGVDFWRFYAKGMASTVMIEPKLVAKFERFLEFTNMTSKVVLDDVEDALEQDRQSRSEYRKTISNGSVDFTTDPNFNIYWSSDQMETYSRSLAQRFPNRVQFEVIGRSAQNRILYALKISNGGFGNKPLIFIEGGCHAREWVSQATVMYLIHRLVEDPVASNELLENADWIITPNLNPDGYEFSRTNNRLWRQNRRQVNPNCVGVDLNRNFAFSWRTATVACGSQTFSGPSPFSEPESHAINDLMSRYRQNIKIYLTVHSFGDMVLFPWGFQGSPGLIGNHEYHHQVGLLWRNAIQAQTGKVYAVGNVAQLLGNAFGASDDHMAGNQNVNLVYTLELSRGGLTGFDFPESQIGNLVRETFHGYRAIGLHIGRNY
ncbi:Carboxypeptidase B [Pseudolycoriella hygida]|uniref:Carboxypeptidase B n=1 Tax=Pseudolycoriella hygida TaxID=35572 RepID=A0A9Q0MV80_9DIPT|nr:Carboxypeptidase B [Pseudolycoriella hygida]